MTGTIRTLRVDKGFGFIKDEGGNDYFFHQSAIYGEGIDMLREGDSVEFELGADSKGRRFALKLVRLNERPNPPPMDLRGQKKP